MTLIIIHGPDQKCSYSKLFHLVLQYNHGLQHIFYDTQTKVVDYYLVEGKNIETI